MMVGRIAPYSVYPSYSRSKTTSAIKANPIDSVAFKGSAPRVLSDELVKIANAFWEKTHGEVVSLDVPGFGKCEAISGEIGRRDALCLNVRGVTGYIITILDDNTIGTSSEFLMRKIRERGFAGGEDIPLTDPKVYAKAVKNAKTILEALLTGKNQHPHKEFPCFPPLGVKHPEPVAAHR